MIICQTSSYWQFLTVIKFLLGPLNYILECKIVFTIVEQSYDNQSYSNKRPVDEEDQGYEQQSKRMRVEAGEGPNTMLRILVNSKVGVYCLWSAINSNNSVLSKGIYLLIFLGCRWYYWKGLQFLLLVLMSVVWVDFQNTSHENIFLFLTLSFRFFFKLSPALWSESYSLTIVFWYHRSCI